MKSNLLLLVSLFITSLGYAQELIPTEDEALVTIKVTDYAEIPEEGASITIHGVDTSVVKKGNTDVDGKFAVLLTEGKKYKVSVNKFGEDFNFEKPIDIPKKVGTIKFEQKLKIKLITEYIRTYTLDHVYFDVNKYEIKKQSMPALSTLLNSLKGNPKMKVEIAGHTDDVGDAKSNMELSQKRADEVMKFLLHGGISQNRILAKGYGKSSPVAANTDEEGRQKNRRTEVRIIEE